MPNPVLHIKDSSVLTAAQDTARTTSLFQDHLLSPASEAPKLHFTDFDFGVALILFLAFILFVWLYSTNRKRLNHVVRAFYISRFSNQMGRDELSLGNRVSVFLSLLFVVTSSLFIYQSGTYYGYLSPGTGLQFCLKMAALIAATYGLKILFVRFFGYIFQNQKEAGEYSTLIFLFCNILGLFLLPIVVCLAFVNSVPPLIFIYSGFGVFILLLLIRVLRGVLIGVNSTRVSKFYLFLYLCTLEILPFVIMAKLFTQNVV